MIIIIIIIIILLDEITYKVKKWLLKWFIISYCLKWRSKPLEKKVSELQPLEHTVTHTPLHLSCPFTHSPLSLPLPGPFSKAYSTEAHASCAQDH